MGSFSLRSLSHIRTNSLNVVDTRLNSISAMFFPTSLLVLISLSTATLAQPISAPLAERDISISHTSTSKGTSSIHSIDPASLSPELAEAIMGSHLNINLVTDKRSIGKVESTSEVEKRAAITNSTINLTVIGSRRSNIHRRKFRRPRNPKHSILKERASTPTHHNIYVDASSSSGGKVGAIGAGIHNSTFNINLLNHRASLPSTSTTVGQASVLLDTSADTSSDTSSITEGGIEDSTVHINILPSRRHLTIPRRSRPRKHKALGDHSILIDSSSNSLESKSSTTTGKHSAVVDTSSTSSLNSTESKGIKSSTINVTVVSPKKDKVKRSSLEWAGAINRRTYDAFENARRSALGLTANVRFAKIVRRRK